MSTSRNADYKTSDASAVRAMAHPARMAALEHLMKVGPATATELGEAAGLTPSAMSYHLRSLERAHLIETAPSRGDGRERVWQSAYHGVEIETIDDGSPEMATASRELLEAFLAIQDVSVRQWLARADTPGWLSAGFFTETTVLVTDEEMTELGRAIADLIKPYTRRHRTDAPTEARPMSAIFRGYPIDPPKAAVESS